MRAAFVVVVVSVVGCVRADSVACGDGVVCPAGTVCEPVRQLCIAPEQTTACRDGAGIADGYPCVAGATSGICDRGLCLPGCGDGITNGAEECDDGNFKSHDGCSSRCLVEVPSWSRFEPAWQPLAEHTAAYHAGFDEMIVAGGGTTTGLRTEDLEKAGVGLPPFNGWFLRGTSPVPPRAGAMMAYDAKRQRVVLFGGNDGDGVRADTWEHDGNAWIQRSPLASPPGRYFGAMAYDPVAQHVVLFGGTLGATSYNDTWAYDGTTWTQLAPATRPARRYLHAMATDQARGVIVLYAGITPFDGGYSQDTWEYANGVWTQKSATSPPGLRYGSAMAFSRPDAPQLGTMVLFGGMLSTNQAASDTWLYDGAAWTRLASSATPPGRFKATLSFATIGSPGLLLVGGDRSLVSDLHDDVWELIDGEWIERTPRFEPGPRRGAPLAYSEKSKELHVVGGFVGAFVDEHWTIGDSSIWSPSNIDNRPVRFAHVMAYDPKRDAMVVFGGAGASQQPTDTTYELRFDAPDRRWTLLEPATRPPARAWGTLAFDGTSLVLFGGVPGGPNATGAAADTWEFDGATWTQTTGGPRHREQPPRPTTRWAIAWCSSTAREIRGSTPTRRGPRSSRR